MQLPFEANALAGSRGGGVEGGGAPAHCQTVCLPWPWGGTESGWGEEKRQPLRGGKVGFQRKGIESERFTRVPQNPFWGRFNFLSKLPQFYKSHWALNVKFGEKR